MLAHIASAIEARLQGLTVFNKVERAVSGKSLSNPPTVIFRLVSDAPHAGDADQAAGASRLLSYEILIIGSALALDQGQAGLDICIDAVRDAFHDWVAVPEGGCLPAFMGTIELVDEVKNLLVYAGLLRLVCLPAVINEIKRIP